MEWEKAGPWAEKANTDKDIDAIEPRWSWDCGLKLDFDGGLLRVSSRFYQRGDSIFSGQVAFLIGDDEIAEREFCPRHVDILKTDVEQYVATVRTQVREILSANKGVFMP